MKLNDNNKIGIIGGMGPQASIELLRLIIDKASTKFGAVNDEDFPEVILNSLSVPDFISDTKNADIVGRIIIKSGRTLAKLGCTQIAIACNTAHIFEREVKKVTGKRFISLINSVAKEVKSRNMKRVAVFATPTTIKTGLYRRKLFALGIQTINLNDVVLNELEKIIRNVLAGKRSLKDRTKLRQLAGDQTKTSSADGVILGCTELPLAFGKFKNPKIISSLDVLADTLMVNYYKKIN